MCCLDGLVRQVADLARDHPDEIGPRAVGQLDSIRQVFHRLEAARGDVELYFQYNFEFHEAILEAAHSPRLKHLVTNLRNAVEPVARRYLIAAGHTGILASS